MAIYHTTERYYCPECKKAVFSEVPIYIYDKSPDKTIKKQEVGKMLECVSCSHKIVIAEEKFFNKATIIE